MRYESFKEENKILHRKIEELEAQLAVSQSKNASGDSSTGGIKTQYEKIPVIPAFSKNPMMQQIDNKKDSKKEDIAENDRNDEVKEGEKKENEAIEILNQGEKTEVGLEGSQEDPKD